MKWRVCGVGLSGVQITRGLTCLAHMAVPGSITFSHIQLCPVCSAGPATALATAISLGYPMFPYNLDRELHSGLLGRAWNSAGPRCLRSYAPPHRSSHCAAPSLASKAGPPD